MCIALSGLDKQVWRLDPGLQPGLVCLALSALTTRFHAVGLCCEDCYYNSLGALRESFAVVPGAGRNFYENVANVSDLQTRICPPFTRCLRNIG